ncbi:unnamed protein product [Spirodela intermedia]|uniref:CHCH domain-containing protein n=1 Tax=Spirodela intermedia TaxID=51605 RepID=A0A7I8IZS1_SPIIN|nr:unnamed protein product [Spirodela intermedia]CAA6663093.1 unnamed protein product [Spirodela intermedia]
MPRRSSGTTLCPPPAPRAAPMRNPPQPVSQAPPPAPLQSGGGSILGGSAPQLLRVGMAFGTGSAVAHRAVDAVMGPRTVQHEYVDSGAAPAAAAPTAVGADSCNIHSRAFQDCINSNGADISKCQFYLDMLNECRRGSSSSMLGA